MSTKRSSKGSRNSKRSTSSIKRGLSSVEPLKSVTEIEEVDSNEVATEIMQEILEKSLETIQERYLENQTINLVVHCAHQALCKALRIHFYQHNDYIRTIKYWGSDKRVEPSGSDSWALNQVPLSKNISSDQEINTLSKIKLELAAKGQQIAGDGLELASVPSESLIEDLRAIIDEIIDNLLIMDEETSEKSESVTSAFTMVVEGAQHYNEYKMKPQLSRISVGGSTMFKLPRLDLPDSGASRRYQSLTELSIDEVEKLPPIRTDANYKCRSLSLQEEKIKKLTDKKTKEKKT